VAPQFRQQLEAFLDRLRTFHRQDRGQLAFPRQPANVRGGFRQTDPVRVLAAQLQHGMQKRVLTLPAGATTNVVVVDADREEGRRHVPGLHPLEIHEPARIRMDEIVSEVDRALDRIDMRVDQDGGAMQRQRGRGRLLEVGGHDWSSPIPG